GFLFTSASILIAMSPRPIIKWGRETGAYPMLAGYLTRGIWWCLNSAFTTMLMFLPDFEKPAAWHRVTCCVWLATVVGAAVAIVRVLLILTTILRQVAKEDS